MKKIITLSSEDKVYIAVYHLGYSKQGESNIFILYTEEKVLYSLTIDCYQEEQCNMTDQILSELGLENKLNVFIWTHPHDDHSIGIKDIIKKYCNKDSLIFLANVFGCYDKLSVVCQQNIDYLKSINYRKQVKDKWKIHSYVHYPEVMDEIIFNGENEVKKISVHSISPFTQIGGMLGTEEKIDCNKLGIACILMLELKDCNMNFLFGGDMEKYTIQALIEENDDSLPRVFNYIKIPHHGSKNAENMIEYLKWDNSIKSEFASTSVFTQKNLPRKEVLKKYREVVDEIACTSNIEDDIYGQGMICLKYDVMKREVIKEFWGTAKVVNYS